MDSDRSKRIPEGPFDDLEDPLDAPSSEGVGTWPIVVGLLVAVALVGYVVFDGLDAETYFYTVDQAVAQGEDIVGQTVRVKGQVEPGTIQGSKGELGRKFRIAEKGKSMWVTYDRALPDTFKEGVQVVAEGTVDDSHTLVADEVMVKCPSRYKGGPSHPDGVPKGNTQASR